MNKFVTNIKAIFAKLGFADKAKGNSMTAADWQAVRAAYKEEFGTELADDQAEYEQAQTAQAQQQQAEATAQQQNAAALAIIQSALNGTDENPGAGEGDNATAGEGTPAPASSASQSGSIVDAAQAIAGALNSMSRQSLPDNAPAVGAGVALSASGPGHTAEYFCGIPHAMFAMTHRHNRVALNPGIAAIEPISERIHGPQIRAELENYSQGIADRITLLARNNTLNPKALTEGVINVGIAPEGLGDQYLIRRQDALIARIAAIKNVYDIFPRRFGVQDREVMINAFFGDFSQAHQKGQVWKGNVKLEPEFGYVDDAMFKTQFDSMKDMERQYIGYLNKEGSDPIKWTLIEWAVLHISTKLIKEQSERKLLGIYIKPTAGTPGHRLNAGTGVYYTMLRYYNEGKVALLGEEFSSYDTGEDMVETVVAALLHLAEEVPDLDEYEVILNGNHRAKWITGVREKYGRDNDFTGPQGDVVPDTLNRIRWCPYLGKLPLILIQQPGNIQSLELEAGEMHAIKFKEDMEEVNSWSTWKEGTSAEYAGRPFATKALRAANGYDEQMIFMNKPSLPIDVDATVVEAEGDYRHYVTEENTAAAAITDIAGAKPGVAYMIEVGSESNPQTIAKAGKFTGITKAYAPTKVGDYIMVILNDDGDGFLELERCEGEVRTINKALQPNVPGGR